MKRKTLVASVAAIALAAIATVPVFAHSGHTEYGNRADAPYNHQGMGPRTGAWNMPGGPMGGMDMMQMMRMMQMMNGQGDDMGMGAMPMNMHGIFGAGNNAFIRSLDTNNDGQVSKEEFGTGLLGILKNSDSDRNGTLSIDEFAPAYAAAVRWQMVDQFQALDDNGDGQVTADEINAAADRMTRIWMTGGPGYGVPMDGYGMPMNGDRIQGNQQKAGPRGQQNMPMMDNNNTDKN